MSTYMSYQYLNNTNQRDAAMNTNEFSISIKHNGQTYFATGKTGTNIKTGIRVAEMESDDCHRIWIDANNRVYAD